jgi:hypothetical protein
VKNIEITHLYMNIILIIHWEPLTIEEHGGRKIVNIFINIHKYIQA